jgi:hypothetical protein
MVTDNNALTTRERANRLFERVAERLHGIVSGTYYHEDLGCEFPDADGSVLTSNFHLTISFSDLIVSSETISFRLISTINQLVVPKNQIGIPEAVRVADREYVFDVVLDKRVTTGTLMGYKALTDSSINVGKKALCYLADASFDGEKLFLTCKDMCYSEVTLQYSEPMLSRENAQYSFAADGQTIAQRIDGNFLDPLTLAPVSSTLYECILNRL